MGQSARNANNLRHKVLGFAGIWLAAATLLLPMPLHAADSTVNVSVCYPTLYPAPTVTAPSDGSTTTDTSVVMQGQATPNIFVYAYRNNAQVGFVTSGGDGSWAISVSLDTGTNELKASTNNDCAPPTFSNAVTITRTVPQPPPPPPPPPNGGGQRPTTPRPRTSTPDTDQEPTSPTTPASPSATPPANTTNPGNNSETTQPSLTITEPKSGTRVTQPTIIVSGRGPAASMVRLLRNGQAMAQVLTDSEGKFMVSVGLEPGENRLVITTGSGIDARSSSATVVFYDPPESKSASFVVPIALVSGGVITSALVFVGIRWGMISLPWIKLKGGK